MFHDLTTSLGVMGPDNGDWAGEGWPGGAWFGARCGPKEGEEMGQPRRPPSTCLGSQAGADEGQCEEEPPSGHKGQVLVS